MSGHEEREHLVDQLRVGHRLALLVACLDQHREDVGPALRALAPAAGDLGDELGADRLPVADEATPGRETPELDLEGPDGEEGCGGAVGLREEADDALPDAGEARALVHPEHGAEDDVEGDRLHLVMDREGLPEGPAVDHAVGDLAHDAAVDVHPLAVERRCHQASLAVMALAVQQQDRVPPEDGTEDRAGGLAGAELRPVAGEDLLDGLGVGEHDHRGPTERVGRVAVAVPTGGDVERRVGPERVAQTLEEARCPRSPRQRSPRGNSAGHGGQARRRGRFWCEPGLGSLHDALPLASVAGARSW